MTLPPWVREELEMRLGPVRSAAPVGGGCINAAARVELAAGPVFVKHNADAPAGLFSCEAEGLSQLRAAASGLRVPQVLVVRDPEPGARGGWIALEWLQPARPAAGHGERLGRALAALHRARGRGWGWHRDGFIGSLPQPNGAAADWARFWVDRRLEPQLQRARRAGHSPGTRAEWDRLFLALPRALADAESEGPSLLHGDLWSGNALAVEPGDPALVDPASYHGHREVDLAMAELFGGFGERFHHAYREHWPLLPGYAEVRRPVYQLYYLLVHVALFGQGYVERTVSTLRRALAAS